MLQSEFSVLDVTLIEPGSEGCNNAIKRGVKNTHPGVLDSFRSLDHFDNIGLFDVLKHVQNDKEFLCGISDRLSDDGRVFITVPAYQFLWSKEDVDAGHYRRYSFSQLERVVTSSGFE